MKKIIFILLFIFIIIGIAEVKSFNNSTNTNENIKALNSTVQACTVDMQKDSNIICD